MLYHLGRRVEVLDNEPGLESRYHSATIIGTSVHNCLVAYDNHNYQVGNPYTELLPVANIRPYPSAIEVDLSLGDQVDAWFNNSWVLGKLRRYDPANPEGLVYRVRFDYLQNGERLHNFKREHVRMHQECDNDFVANWAYRRITGYHPGQKVEIKGFEDSMKHSYYAARMIVSFGREVVVEYETLTDDSGELARAECPTKYIRPYPARVVGRLVAGDPVDVWLKGGWWEGTYRHEVPDQDGGFLHSVLRDYMPEGEQIGLFTTEHLRIHQDFYFDDPTNYIGCWAYQNK